MSFIPYIFFYSDDDGNIAKIPGKVGKKKLQKMQDKADKKKQHEAEKQEREERKKRLEKEEQERKLQEDKEQEIGKENKNVFNHQIALKSKVMATYYSGLHFLSN